ncbi:hypothetical protein KFE94_06810 [bacterium SCSIO 12643]|nr:hypothetical protein KFE94_06810 [bacterium SCSIO 12643]
MSYDFIGDHPQNYSSGNIISRFIDGLGFRYYWVTEGLTENDLKFKPSETGQSTMETIRHIYWLAFMVNNTLYNRPSNRSFNAEIESLDFNEIRNGTLDLIKDSSSLSRSLSEEQLSQLEVQIQSGDKIYSYPLWNMMNGPLSDALYHTGQIVSFRRSSGNPIRKGVNVFLGKLVN